MLSIDGVDELLPAGQPREVTLGDRRYLAVAHSAHSYFCPDIIDGSGLQGSAYLAPIAE